MRRRTAIATVSVAAILPMLSGVSEAKCCWLDHIVIGGENLGEPIRLERSFLAARVSEGSLYLVYGPVLYGIGKGNARPVGALGPGYEVTYVLQDVEGDPIPGVLEIVYPHAHPPTAFAPRGQTYNLGFRGRDSRVPWGWRPFPEEVAAVIALWAGRANQQQAPVRGGPLDAFDPALDQSWVRPVITITGGFIGGGLILLFIRRRGRRGSDPPVT